MMHFLRKPSMRSHLQRLWKFAIAGGLGAVVDFSLLNAIVWALRSDPRIANIFSTLIASCVVFLINKHFAFRDRRGKATGQAARFTIAYALAYILNVVFTALFITVGIRLLPTVPLPLVSNVSKALAIGSVMFWNYFLLHSFVFKGEKVTGEEVVAGI
jgi:putative flippase GtrA